MLQKFREGQPRTRKRNEPQATQEQKEHWREYNKSELGKNRYRRWRQSAQGKVRLRENYRRRKEWLDEIKAKTGCLSCGESNPHVLRFRPRDPQKVEFLPALKNVSRGKEGWIKVIKACDVFCLNCLAKKKAPRKSRRMRRKVREGPEISQESAVNASPCGDLQTPRPNHAHSCGCCRSPLTKAGQRFCSPRCRLLFWAARNILGAYRSGQAEGLEGIITELAEMR